MLKSERVVFFSETFVLNYSNKAKSEALLISNYLPKAKIGIVKIEV